MKHRHHLGEDLLINIILTHQFTYRPISDSMQEQNMNKVCSNRAARSRRYILSLRIEVLICCHSSKEYTKSKIVLGYIGNISSHIRIGDP